MSVQGSVSEARSERDQGLTLDFVMSAEPAELVAGLTAVSIGIVFPVDYELAVTGIFRLMNEHEHVRAATVAMTFNMLLLAKAILIEAFEAHPSQDDPYRSELVEIGRLVAEKLEE